MSTITDLQTLINTNLESASNITAVELRAVLNSFLTTTAHLYEVKQLDVPTSFIADNFDATGLGIGNYVGWAICNGNNGTIDRGGRVAIGYDETNYDELGAVGGSKNAVLIGHTHTIGIPTYPNVGDYLGLYDQATPTNFTNFTTSKVGINENGTSEINEDGTDKNMQPYLVTLFIQRIA